MAYFVNGLEGMDMDDDGDGNADDDDMSTQVQRMKAFKSSRSVQKLRAPTRLGFTN